MWIYAIRRILFVIPTIALILISAFLIWSFSNSDEVADLIALEGERGYASREGYLKTYRSYAERYGYNRPVFYITIRPDYIPDEIDAIIPLSRKQQLTTILHETHRTAAVLQYSHLLDEIIANIEVSDHPAALRRLVLSLEKAQHVEALRNGIRQLEGFSDEDLQLLPHSTQLMIRELIGVVDELTYSQGWVFPQLRWHGSHNRFHLWLMEGFNFGRGISVVDGTPAMDKVYKAMKWTLALSVITLLIIGVGSLFLALLQVYYSGKFVDQCVSTTLYIFYTMPLFWIASMMVVFFTTEEYGSWMDIFPSIGIKAQFGINTSFIAELRANASRLVLPVLCLSLHSLAYFTKQLREEMIDISHKPYILAARARGLSEWQLLKGHVLPNAMISYITLMTGGIASLLTGSVVIEVIFNIPGLGRLLLDSIAFNDWPVIFLILIMVGITTILGYLISDLILGYKYPKIRSQMELT